MPDGLFELIRLQTDAEAIQTEEALSRAISGEMHAPKLPALLEAVRGLNYERLGLVADANRILLDIYQNSIAYFHYANLINEFRIKHTIFYGDNRPRILSNIYANSIASSTQTHADVISFEPGKELGRPRPGLITYRLNEDTFESILNHLPESWTPECVLIFLPEVTSLPMGLEKSPYPVIGIPGDPWDINKLRHDLVLFDALMPAMKHMVPVYRRICEAPVLYTSCAGIQGCVPWLRSTFASPGHPKEYDLVFTGMTSTPFYRQRDHYLWRLLKLAGRYRTFVGFTNDLADSLKLMGRAKIAVHCPSLQGGVNRRPFEVAMCGALLMHEEGDGSIEEFFEPGKEIVLFNRNNFEELIKYYLSHDAERERIAAGAMERGLRQQTIQLHMMEAIELIRCSGIKAGLRKAREISEDVKLNSLGISDFYALNYSRSVDCFRKAMEVNGANGGSEKQQGKYLSNLSVSLMLEGMLSGESHPEIRSQLLEAHRMEPRSAVTVFNLASYFRYISPDMNEFQKWAGSLVRRLSGRREGIAPYTGDELIFSVPTRSDRKTWGEFHIFRLELDRALLEFAQGSEEYQRTIMDTLLWKTFDYMGDICVMRNEVGGAVAAFKSALRYLSANEPILWKLSKIYLDLGALKEAVPLLRQILELSPLHESTHLELARAEEALGMKKEAVERLERLLNFDALTNRDQFLLLLERARL